MAGLERGHEQPRRVGVVAVHARHDTVPEQPLAGLRCRQRVAIGRASPPAGGSIQDGNPGCRRSCNRPQRFEPCHLVHQTRGFELEPVAIVAIDLARGSETLHAGRIGHVAQQQL
jgi:hypothetical protein